MRGAARSARVAGVSGRRHPLPPLPSATRVGDGRRAGLSRQQILRLPAPFHGVRVGAPPRTLVEQAVALRPLLGPQQCFGRLTAAALHGLRLPDRCDGRPLEVLSLGGGRAMRRPGVRGVSVAGDRERWRTRDDLPVTSPVDTWCDLGATLHVDDLVGVLDSLVRRRRPFTTIDEVRAHLAARGRTRGAARLRQALSLARAGTDSWRETMLRLLLVRAGLPEPEVNGEIRDPAGRVIAHGDLVWHDQRTIVEYEGRQHWEDAAQFSIDILRIDRLLEERWDHIRVDKLLLARPADLVARVTRSLTRRPSP